MDRTDSLEIELNALKTQLAARLNEVRMDLDMVHGERSAMDLWIHALIATHPDPSALKACVLNLISQVQKQPVDGLAQGRATAYSRLLSRYGQFFDQVHKLPPQN